MQLSESKRTAVTDSVLLPSFSFDAANSLSKFSVKLSNKHLGTEKLSDLLHENANHLLKASQKCALPPALPSYYYTSTFPSLFASVAPIHRRKLKKTSKKISVINVKNTGTPQESKPNQPFSVHNLEEFCKSKLMPPNVLQDESQPVLQSPIKCADATKTTMTCMNNQNERTLQKIFYCKNTVKRCTEDSNSKEDTRSICLEQENVCDSAGKVLKENHGEDIDSCATSSKKRNQSMSYSRPKCRPRDEAQLRRRHHSTLTHVVNSTTKQRQRAATSSGSVGSLQFSSTTRPTTSNTQLLLDRTSTATASSDSRPTSISKKDDNEKLSKKQLNTSFERYYSAQLQANKAKIIQRKAERGNAPPRQTFWAHSSESKPLTKRNKCKTKVKSAEKTKTLHKLKNLKIETKDEKTNTHSSSENSTGNQYEHNKVAKGDASSKPTKPTHLQNQTTQTSTTVVCRLSDKSQLSCTKTARSFHYSPKPLLSPEQLVIRDSIEKVRRWMKTLPKHFDAIQQVLPPAQQDY